ncbi:expressed unknown protein [Seminavis robusta]|uniref:Uncharacterized protein n=1 Tax=Seminavis robusta TaxID=568900 RepID=A0A9N8HI07_9STRA|nr:expressed unknown protein [Seminavis robusta]|eukprot:Sro594_g172550.1 n/a (588) ;mRNA; r:52505-54268
MATQLSSIHSDLDDDDDFLPLPRKKAARFNKFPPGCRVLLNCFSVGESKVEERPSGWLVSMVVSGVVREVGINLDSDEREILCQVELTDLSFHLGSFACRTCSNNRNAKPALVYAKESRLVFAIGSPVFVKIQDEMKKEEETAEEVEGIVVGSQTCTLEGRQDVVYSIQTLQGRCAVLHGVDPSKLTYRSEKTIVKKEQSRETSGQRNVLANIHANVPATSANRKRSSHHNVQPSSSVIHTPSLGAFNTKHGTSASEGPAPTGYQVEVEVEVERRKSTEDDATTYRHLTFSQLANLQTPNQHNSHLKVENLTQSVPKQGLYHWRVSLPLDQDDDEFTPTNTLEGNGSGGEGGMATSSTEHENSIIKIEESSVQPTCSHCNESALTEANESDSYQFNAVRLNEIDSAVSVPETEKLIERVHSDNVTGNTQSDDNSMTQDMPVTRANSNGISPGLQNSETGNSSDVEEGEIEAEQNFPPKINIVVTSTSSHRGPQIAAIVEAPPKRKRQVSMECARNAKPRTDTTSQGDSHQLSTKGAVNNGWKNTVHVATMRQPDGNHARRPARQENEASTPRNLHDTRNFRVENDIP